LPAALIADGAAVSKSVPAIRARIRTDIKKQDLASARAAVNGRNKEGINEACSNVIHDGSRGGA
jgi:hypothetical protein